MSSSGANVTAADIATLTAQMENMTVVINSMWISLNTFLVFVMQAGFAMLEAGTVREKNVQGNLVKNLLDVIICTATFFFFGYGFAFGEDVGGFIGNSLFAADGFEGTDNYMLFVFHWCFASTAATIISGSLAERTHIVAYVVTSAFTTALTYPVVAHWVWGGGWLSELGYHDFAGDGPVHMVGGIAGFVGCLIVGPRKDRFDEGTYALNTHTSYAHAFIYSMYISTCLFINTYAHTYLCSYMHTYIHSLLHVWTFMCSAKADQFRPSNAPMVVLGTLLLWFGWYGFNCGSTLAFENDYSAPKVAMNTTLAAAAGGLMAFFIDYMGGNRKSKYRIVPITNGILAGLVAITGGCDQVTSVGAIIIGCGGGVVWAVVSALLVKYRVDDPLDATTVHGACGFWGIMSIGLFSQDSGVFYGGDGRQLWVQFIGAASITLWSGGLSGTLYLVLKYFKILRTSASEEESGMDHADCGGSAYSFNSKDVMKNFLLRFQEF